MNELMLDYKIYAATNQWSEAHDTLYLGVSCGYIPAKIELAKLYRDCPHIGIPQKDRYLKAEALFQSVLNLLDDLPERDFGQISLELATLYGYMRRPVGELAMLLRARRYHISIPEYNVTRTRKAMEECDINQLGANPRDAFELAVELDFAGGSERMTELLLREAYETDDKVLRGQAALALADFYNERRFVNSFYAKEAFRYYKLASEAGYPQYLTRCNA